MPKQLHTMTKVAGANAIIVPFVFFNEEYVAYEAQYGSARTDMDYQTNRAHFTPRLEALEYATIAHLGLWGTSFALNILGMTKIFKLIFAPIAALWIEHMLSNFALAVTGYVAYLLYNADFGIGTVLAYVTQGFIMWYLERAQGMAAIKTLRPNYPWLDGTLKMSLFYLLRINKHLEEYPFMDAEWPEVSTSGESVLLANF